MDQKNVSQIETKTHSFKRRYYHEILLLRYATSDTRFLAIASLVFRVMCKCALHSFLTKQADQRLKLFSFSSFYFKTL